MEMPPLLLPADEQKFEQLIKKVVDKISPEKIFLVSASTAAGTAQSIFSNHPISGLTDISYEIVVLTRDADRIPADDIQDILENHPCFEKRLSVIVYPMAEFNTCMVMSDYFACTVFESALLCYDAGTLPFALPGTMDRETLRQELLLDFQQYLKRSIEFLQAVKLQISRKQYGLAVCQLHQAAEQVLGGLLCAKTGCKAKMHNLDKLYRYTRTLIPGIAEVFPLNTKAEKQLFRYLQISHAKAKYSNNLMIRKNTIMLLTDRVKQLIRLCQAYVPAK